MTEVATPAAVAPLRRELEFVKSLLKSGRSVDEMVAAANAAARVAARTVEEMKKTMQRRGTELTLRGLPTSEDWDWLALKRWLQSRGVGDVKYTAKDAGSDVGVVRFSSEVACDIAADMIPSCKPPVPECTVVVERGVSAEYQDRVRKRDREGDDDRPRKNKFAAAEQAPSVCDAVCPLWKVPYSQQLTDKHQRIVDALAEITTQVDRRTYGSDKPDWVRAARSLVHTSASSSSGAAPPPLCCPLLGILRSPVIERYRNKSEFTAGLDDKEKPCVGYLRGAFQQGITCVGPPDETRHTSHAAVVLAAAAANYIRDVSRFEVYDKRRQEGYWRLVLVRDGRRKSFLPVPVPAGTDPAGQRVLADPTFDSLDPWTYLVTFGKGTAGPAAAAAAPEPAAPKAEEGQGEGKAEAMEVEVAGGAGDGTAAAAAAGAAGGGMDVSAVSEAEPTPPPPDEVLVMLQVHPMYTRALADPAAAARELRGMTAALHAAAAAADLPLTTVRVQYHSGVSNAAPADAPVLEVPEEVPKAGEGAEEQAEDPAVAAAVAASSGPGYIHDALCELEFQISSTAFFQVNSAATCVLYKVVGDWAAARPSTLLLDICCGTGTIGLTMARRVSKVVGVDSVASAIDDARRNAALNGITNAEFVTGKAEDALPGILAAHAADERYSDVVAVADPPRAGLHRSVVMALLGCQRIRRLVFVSCNPENLVANVALLCKPPDSRSGRDRGGYGGRGRGRGGWGRGGGGGRGAEPDSYTPFRPVKATALDLFPHTAHVEAVMLLER